MAGATFEDFFQKCEKWKEYSAEKKVQEAFLVVSLFVCSHCDKPQLKSHQHLSCHNVKDIFYNHKKLHVLLEQGHVKQLLARTEVHNAKINYESVSTAECTVFLQQWRNPASSVTIKNIVSYIHERPQVQKRLKDARSKLLQKLLDEVVPSHRKLPQHFNIFKVLSALAFATASSFSNPSIEPELSAWNRQNNVIIPSGYDQKNQNPQAQGLTKTKYTEGSSGFSKERNRRPPPNGLGSLEPPEFQESRYAWPQER